MSALRPFAILAATVVLGWMVPLAPAALGLLAASAACSDFLLAVLLTRICALLPLAPVFGLAGVLVGWGERNLIAIGVELKTTQRRILGWLVDGWLLNSAVGAFIGALVGMILWGITNITWETPADQLVSGFWLGAYVGLAIGIAQWRAIQQNGRKYVLWIPASTLAWGLAGGLFWIVYNAAGGPYGVWYGKDCGAAYFGADPRPPVDWAAFQWAVGCGWVAGGLLLAALFAFAIKLLWRPDRSRLSA